MDRTTIILPLPGAEPAVGPWRREHDWSAALDVPAHITLLGPFVPPAELGDVSLRRLAGIFRGARRLRFTLDRLVLMNETALLLPGRTAELERLTGELERGWPDVPRFGAGHERPLHHVTLGQGFDGTLFARAQQALAPQLPLAVVADEALLLAWDGRGPVRELARLPLSSAAR